MFRVTAVCVLAALLAGCAGQGTGVDGSDLEGIEGGDLDDPAYLIGQVVDVEIVPIEGVDVGISNQDMWTTTDEKGTFRLGPLEPGTYGVTAEKKGYLGASTDITITGQAPAEVMLTIEPMASDVPFHETFIFQGYVMCHVVLTSPAGQILNAPCAAVIDLVAPNTAPDDWIFPFSIEYTGFASLMLEMTWRTQQFGHDGLMQLTTLATPDASGGGVTIGGTVYGDTMANPFHAVIHQGNSYWENSEGPVVFYPDPDEPTSFELMVAGGGDNSTLPGQAVFYEFRPTAYVTAFYNRPASAGFTALPDE